MSGSDHSEAAGQHDHDDGYTGPATVLVAEQSFELEVTLAGYFQPLDGRYHWYGRLSSVSRLSELVGPRTVTATVCTPHGRAQGELRDPDLWNRLRIEGISTPPFSAMPTPAEPDSEQD